MLKQGERIGDWIVVDVLGEGGMGAVFRCKNALSDRLEAAVKVVKPHSLENEMERFLREVESLDHLRHRAVVRVKGWGKDSEHGLLWLAMDLVTGEDLEKRLARGPIPIDDARRLFAIVADALHHAHGLGIFHRDIKPANIILAADGYPRIVDFGIAVQKGRTRLTAMGTIPGTPAYMAPEIFAGEARPDPIKVDVYALGQVLYEAVTGEHAYPDDDETDLSTGQKLVALMGKKLKAEPLDPGPDYPDELRALLRKATAPEPADRMADMAAFVAGLTGGPSSQAGANRSDPTFGLDLQSVPAAPPTEWVKSKPADTAPRAAPAKSQAKAQPPKSEPPKPPPEPAKAARSDPKAVSTARPASSGGRTGTIAIAGAAGVGLFVLVGFALALLAVVAVAAGVAFYSSMGGRDTADTAWIGEGPDGVAFRDVQVAVTGLAAGTPFDVTVDGLTPDSTEGMTWHFGAVPVGSRTVKVTAGPGCVAAEEGPCAGCCACSEQVVEVVTGTEPQTVLAHLSPPPIAGPRAVRIKAPLIADGWSTFVDLGGATGPKGKRVDSRTKEYATVQPGVYEARVEAGRCPTTAQGCWPDGDCPEGCSSWKGTITVPCGSDTYVHTIDLPTPSGKPPAPEPASSTACRRTCPSGAFGGGSLAPGDRVEVVALHEEDAYCGYGIVGLSGTVSSEMHSNDGCWLGGDMVGDDGAYYYFYKVAVKATRTGGVAPAPAPVDRFGDGRYVTSVISYGTTVRIVDVHPDDAYYGYVGQLVGVYCTASTDLSAMDTGWFAGSLYCPDVGSELYFYKVAVGP